MSTITWKNTAAPSFGGVAALAKVGNDAQQSGLNALQNLARGMQQRSIAADAKVEQDNTDALRANMLSAKTPEERQAILDNAAASGNPYNQLQLAQSSQTQGDRNSRLFMEGLEKQRAEIGLAGDQIGLEGSQFTAGNRKADYARGVKADDAALATQIANARKANAGSSKIYDDINTSKEIKAENKRIASIIQNNMTYDDGGNFTGYDDKGIAEESANELIPLNKVNAAKELTTAITGEDIRLKQENALKVAAAKSKSAEDSRYAEDLLATHDKDWFWGDSTKDSAKLAVTTAQQRGVPNHIIGKFFTENSDMLGNLNSEDFLKAVELNLNPEANLKEVSKRSSQRGRNRSRNNQ